MQERTSTCGWCDKDWPTEKCGDEDGYGPRPACGPGSYQRFQGLMSRLSEWRNADHADNIALSRSEIIDLIEGVKSSSLLTKVAAAHELADEITARKRLERRLEPDEYDVALAERLDSLPGTLNPGGEPVVHMAVMESQRRRITSALRRTA